MMNRSENASSTTYLVDASVYVFRGWYSIGEEFVDIHGKPCNALFGYVRFLVDLLERTQAAHLACAFDESLSRSFRNEIYPAYKANRDPAPPALKRQFGLARQFTEALGIHCVSSPRFEADDLIAAMACKTRLINRRVCVVSVDKDLAQLLEPDDEMWDYARGRSVTPDTLRADVGVSPSQVPDYLALVGDSVDNIPGVRGVGPKSAVALLQRFGSLEGIFKNLDAVKDLGVRGSASLSAKLCDAEETSFLFRRLTRLDNVADIDDLDPHQLVRQQPDVEQLMHMVDECRLGQSIAERLTKLCAPQ